MEKYADFQERILAFETRELRLGNKDFGENAGLCKKVFRDGKFRDFFGDTIIFDLDSAAKSRIDKIIGNLYENCGGVFAERLDKNQLHVTLHDLKADSAIENIAEDISKDISKIFYCPPFFPPSKIKMKATAVFNMTNTSLCLGLLPATDADFQSLFSLYELFDDLKKIGYPFTPHVTLAYFLPKKISAED